MDRPASCERTYTFRLAGPPDGADASWRRHLWATHQAVNRGGRIVGEWLLTLRGGLCHTLAEMPRGPTHARSLSSSHSARQARRQRVLLALSWLSVESKHGAPLEFAVASDESGKPDTSAALVAILQARGVPASVIEQWLEDCAPAISAPVRDDAVWINRSAAFDSLVAGQNVRAAREDCRQVLWNLFTDQYLVLPLEAGKSAEGEPASALPRWRAASAGAGQRTRHLFSHLFGSSATFGTSADKLRLRTFWSERLKADLAASGMPVDEAPKRGRKRLDDVNRSPSEFHREMFAKAATRLAQTVTKIRQQEANRLRWSEADQKLHQLEVQFPVALACFEQYRQSNPNEPIGAEALYSCREWLLRRAAAKPEMARAAAALGSGGYDDGGLATAVLTEDSLASGPPAIDEPARYNEFNVFWFKGNNAIRDKLKAYSEGTKARAGASLLKAVSYRHPDPYFSPIFCQFGVSRPTVEFERLALDSVAPTADHRGLKLLVWNGQQATIQPLRAISKRFDAEIGCAVEAAGAAPASLGVARRTHLAAAASGAEIPGRLGAGADTESAPGQGWRVEQVFDSAAVVQRRKSDRKTALAADAKTRAPRWNGTLRADRAVLARLGRRAAEDAASAERLAGHCIDWTLNVSLELAPHGPWIEYGNRHGLHDTRYESPSGQRQIITAASGKSEQWRGLAYPFWHPANRASSRKGKAKQLLADLPDLRLLAVIPGHEHGAACAVWQTLSAAQFQLECEHALAAGGDVKVTPMWATIRLAAGPGVQGTAAHTICYRRTAADVRGDGTSHAACWARLERQFFIKLPGEQDDCRRPTADERQAARQLASDLAAQTSDEATNVNQLMLSAMRQIAAGLNRHAQHARIARALGDWASAEADAPADSLAQAIGFWYTMAFSPTWPDAWARDAWREHLGGLAVDGLPAQALLADDQDRPARLTRAQCEQLAQQFPATKRSLARAQWASRWAANDGQPAQPDAGRTIAATGWHRRIRWLHDWVRGRKAGSRARSTGGLSLERLAVLYGTCEQLRGFANRLRPDDSPVTVPERIAARTCAVLERKLDERARQLASRIVEAALGAGSQAAGAGGRFVQPADTQGNRPARAAHWSTAASCHAIVLGMPRNSHDLPPTLAGEQRVMFARLLRQLRLRLTESCQLHGLHLTTASIRHLDRQDARTGAAAIRYREVDARAFAAGTSQAAGLDEASRRVLAARQSGRQVPLPDLYWVALHRAASNRASKSPALLRLPSDDGPLVASLEARRDATGGINAQLNAAAGLGIQPLLDADWPGSWSYVPTVAGRRTQRRPDPARTKGAACLEHWTAEPVAPGQFSATHPKGGQPARPLVDDEMLENQLRDRLLAMFGRESADAEPADLPAGDEAVAEEPVRRKRGRPRKIAQVQPEFMNLWREFSHAELDTGIWRDYANYNRYVLVRGLAQLWDDAGNTLKLRGSDTTSREPKAAGRRMSVDALENTPSTGGPQ